MLAIKQTNKEFDISGGDEFNVYNLAQYIIKETESKSKIKVLPGEKAQPQKFKLDLSAIKSLGYKPKFNNLEGTKIAINWYKNFIDKNSSLII